jgi:ATP-dependent DNA ligase
MLAETTPAVLVVFDLLALGDADLMATPYRQRRALLDEALAGVRPPVFLTPVTLDHQRALEWFDAFEGAGLDGLVCKPLESGYEPDRRTMLKVKHGRTADCVLAGYREHKTSTAERPLLGSLLLGLYDAEGALAHVGVCASFTAARRAELYAELQPLRSGVDEHPWARWKEWAEAEPGLSPGRRPGNVSRWNAGKDLSFVLLRPERVLEVAYDHMEGTRFRHTTQFRRWRPDRDPASCTFAQLEEPVTYDLAEILPGV